MISRLKQLRKNILKLSQEEFANKLDISRANMSSIEIGRVALTERNIKAICQIFNVNEDWLRNGNEPIFNNDYSSMDINQRIKYFRTKISKNAKGKNYSQEEFANHIGLKKSAMSDIERCKANLTERNIKLICQTFNVNEDWLRNGNEPIFNEKDNNNYVDELVKKYNINSDEVNIIKRFANLDENSRNKIINFVFEIVKENIDKIDENKILQFSDTTKIGKYTVNNINEELSITEDDIQEIKLYEIPASAGTGSFIDCDVPYEIKKVDLTVAPQARRSDFALYVRGDSIEPDYYDGDIVFVKEQAYVDNGQIGIFVYDSESYIKKYSIQNDGIYLISLNDKYKPIKVDKSTPFRTCGLVL